MAFAVFQSFVLNAILALVTSAQRESFPKIAVALSTHFKASSVRIREFSNSALRSIIQASPGVFSKRSSINSIARDKSPRQAARFTLPKKYSSKFGFLTFLSRVKSNTYGDGAEICCSKYSCACANFAVSLIALTSFIPKLKGTFCFCLR